MEGARLHLGYRQMQWNGTTLRGHEFHYSKKTPTQDTPAAEGFRYGLLNAQNEPVDTFIYAHDNILASYIHWSPESLLKLIQGE